MHTDSELAPIVLENLFTHYSDFESLSWETFREGVQIHRLYGDGVSGPSAALLKYAPGASAPYHVHTGYEHLIIIAGVQRDAAGERGAGTLVINRPGSAHKVSNQAACIVLAIWEKPVRFDAE